MSHKFFDHTSDIGVELFSDTDEGLFKELALVLKEVVIGKKRNKTKLVRLVHLESFSIENLFFDFASDLVYTADTEFLLPDRLGSISVTKKLQVFCASCGN
ncbi:archease [candidate division WOR-3 bacterium]|nr:archease [candidate division WOR-3 bacterium]